MGYTLLGKVDTLEELEAKKNKNKTLPQRKIIDDHTIIQTENYHVTIIKDEKVVFSCQCNKYRDLTEIYNIYQEMRNIYQE